MFIDTHCHLDFKDFDTDRDEAIARAQKAGIGLLVDVGSSPEGSRRAVELAGRYECVYAAVGIHPHDALTATPEVLEKIRALALAPKVVAIGEVGLDYYRDLSPRDEQQRVFRFFLTLAKELKLPLIIHSRESHADTIALLTEAFPAGGARGVMHCFSGGEAFLKESLALGFYISFSGALTFKNADKLRSVARQVPTERLLIETDAPFLSPQAYRGQRNEPAYLLHTAEELARLHGLTSADIARVTTHNARELFGIKAEERERIVYPIRDSLYINLTNRCTSQCYFCIRSVSDFVKGHKLRLEAEPSAADVLREIAAAGKYREIVFCGYGEPTLRLEVIKEIAAAVKAGGGQVRLVTNGHGNLINKRSIAAELVGLIDNVSVSLNTDTAEQYQKVCHASFGDGTYEEVKRFIRECKEALLKVEVTCLDIPEVDIERCKEIAEKELGVDFRLRRYNVVG